MNRNTDFLALVQNIQASDLTGSQAALLIALATFDLTGDCHPSVRTLSERSCMSERHVTTVTEQLEGQKLIEVDRDRKTESGKQLSNLYTINYELIFQRGELSSGVKSVQGCTQIRGELSSTERDTYMSKDSPRGSKRRIRRPSKTEDIRFVSDIPRKKMKKKFDDPSDYDMEDIAFLIPSEQIKRFGKVVIPNV